MRQITTFILTFTAYITFGQTIPDAIAIKNCKIEIYLVEKGKNDSTKECRYCFWPTVKDLADSAFIKDNEIVGYEITNDQHYLLLSKSALQRLRMLNKSSSSSASFTTRSFAVVINGEPIYGGWFRNGYLDTPVDWIVIPTPFDKDSTGKLSINKGYMFGKISDKYGDPRNNTLLMDCLKKSNRLKSN